MDELHIDGGFKLEGSVTINGAKNAALPMLAATLLTSETVTLRDIPELRDIKTMLKLLTHLGVQWGNGSNLKVEATKIIEPEAPYEIVKTMRASSLILGPLLARCGYAKVSLPGGCAIGARPLDMHLKGLEAMGAETKIEDGYILAKTKKLRGADFTFDRVTVTGTENMMMAATLAEGTTKLRNTAREPEVIDLANCLRKMGAEISGDGTTEIIIQGKEKLHGTEHNIVADRIEAGTYMIAAAMTGGNVLIENVVPIHVEALIEKLRNAGAQFEINDSSIRVAGPKKLLSINCTTAPYPGFATDLQAQWMAAMTVAQGTSVVTETVFENRFMHVAELRRMGANISVQGKTAVIQSVDQLKGAPVMCTDLRASACLVLAGLVADGTTNLQRVYHLDRGYENIEKKLSNLGAHIKRAAAEN